MSDIPKFKDFLAKHHPKTGQGSVMRHAKELGISTKQFQRWLSGSTTPGGEQAILLLHRWNELRNFSPEQP